MNALAENWWAVALRGCAALVFGVAALFWPGLALATLILLFGAYAFVDGIFGIAAGIMDTARPAGHRWSLAVMGVLGVIAGVLAFLLPDLTALALVTLIGAWAILTGVAEIVAAVQLRDRIAGAGEWLVGSAGLLSVLFGVSLLLFPGGGALALTWLIGAFAIIEGMTLVALGLRLRGATGEGAYRGRSGLQAGF